MIFAPDSSVLVIFCKRPRPGSGKQRIAAERGAATAYELSRLLLSTAMEDAFAWEGPVVIAPADPADAGWAKGLLKRAEVVAQHGSNLGERIAHVDRELRAAGAQRILYIGTDAPGLTGKQLRSAARALEQQDFVLAPAADGGVILLGAAVPWPALDALPWETDRLCTALVEACGAERVAQLAAGRDIDHWCDLIAALPGLRADQRHWRQTLADWTARQLRISVVVPVYRDHTALGELLARLAATLALPGERSDRSDVDTMSTDEIIVVEGEPDDPPTPAATGAESADGARRLCEQFGARYLTAPACRGLQLDTGARAATGDILWFLHADSLPDSTSADAIRAHIGSGAIGGYFQFQFRGPRTWYKALLERAINLRSRHGIPYGDQGLFMLADHYRDAGGFAHEPLFEEVALVQALRAAGRFNAVTLPIGVSPRRWERDGWLRRTLHNRWLAAAHRLGVQPAALARRY